VRFSAIFSTPRLQISDDALRANHAFPVELQLDAQHAVCGRMLRPMLMTSSSAPNTVL